MSVLDDSSAVVDAHLRGEPDAFDRLPSPHLKIPVLLAIDAFQRLDPVKYACQCPGNGACHYLNEHAGWIANGRG